MSSPRPEEDSGPSLGSLFRLVHSAMVQEYARWLETTDHHDVKPAHAAILQPLGQAPDGERLTTLAATASITKQSAGALVDSLVESGYVERVADPDDGRATRIRLTARGRRYGREVRAFARSFEAKLTAKLGARRMKDLRGTLDLVLETLREQARE